VVITEGGESWQLMLIDNLLKEHRATTSYPELPQYTAFACHIM